MQNESLLFSGIPAILWGKPSGAVCLFISVGNACDEEAAEFASIAGRLPGKGMQTLVLKLPSPADGVLFREPELTAVGDALRAAADHVFASWQTVSLFADSLGAYAALLFLQDRPFDRALFRSPVLGPGKPSSAEERPVSGMTCPTAILYAGLDKLQPRGEVRVFAERTGATLTVAENSDRGFRGEADKAVRRMWVRTSLR